MHENGNTCQLDKISLHLICSMIASGINCVSLFLVLQGGFSLLQLHSLKSLLPLSSLQLFGISALGISCDFGSEIDLAQ